jgi:exopolyphosphatase / guanosine-5'-triphosphate,3'-diphosphate pyrophosphatase
MKVAVIDLGTNTCNLLVALVDENGYEILHQSKQHIRLGDGNIKDHNISEEALSRTINVLNEQRRIIDNFGVEKIRIVATSAVRMANNSRWFLKKTSEAAGNPVRLITGEKEAELIFKGVLLAMETLNDISLILDIGGGSNELILAHQKKILWKESQPTGMARIISQFNLSDPLKPSEIEILQNFFEARHQPAIQRCREMVANTLVGCSGSFDTIADMIDEVEPGEKKRQRQLIEISDFYTVYDKLIHSNRNQRLNMRGMDNVRVDLIVPAVIFIEHIINKAGISKIIQTDFALREGVLSEVMEKYRLSQKLIMGK